MILSNIEILNAIRLDELKISSLTGNEDPQLPPFNTTSIDLRLNKVIHIPNTKYPLAVDLREGRKTKIRDLLRANCKKLIITESQPLTLDPGDFILGITEEEVGFPINKKRRFAGRVEGKSSRARCGLIVHCTAPTIHNNFDGKITLEIKNLSPWPFLLYPGMYICQLVIEQVCGKIKETGNQFKGQISPTGDKKDIGASK